MRKATFIVREDPALLNNQVFSGNALYGMKSDTYLYVALQQELRTRGFDLATQDLNPVAESELIISLDQVLPYRDVVARPGQRWFLILTEPPTYYPANYEAANHTIFEKIFTWNYPRADNRRYFHYHFAIDFDSYSPYQSVSEAEFKGRKLCTLAAAAFGVSPPPAGSPSLLYERYLTLKWFAEHHPDEFDLYSRGIDPKVYSSFRGARLVGRLLPGFITAALVAKRRRVFERVHRGSIPPDQKIEVLRRYRFYVCYENTGGMPGAISEKIFDCFAAAMVPIYLGDDDLHKLIPPGCFIDRRQFKTHEALYRFLKEMTYAEYSRYICAAEDFLRSPACELFSVGHNVRLITSGMLADVK